jgi:uncharacterized protein YjbI with pentapeptide repeats
MKTREELIELLKTDVKAFNQYREETDYDWIDLSECNFFGENLEGASLQWVNLADTNMESANLKKVNFSFSDLTRANFRWADMRWVDLTEAKIDKSQAKIILKSLSVRIIGQ